MIGVSFRSLNRRTGAVLALSFIAVAACIMGIWILSADARRELDALTTANAESSQWSIAQSEVELLALEVAVLSVIRDDMQGDFQALRRRFDIFYSRMQTLQQTRLLEDVRDETDVALAIDRVIARLDGVITLIDGPDEALREGLDNLAFQVREIRSDLRYITLESVRVFARTAERQREQVVDALRDLAILIVILGVVLTSTVLALVWSLMLGRRRTAEIARAQTRLRTVVDTSLDGVLVVGHDGRILDFNRAAEQIFSYSQQEALGARMAELILPDHLKDAHKAGVEALWQGDQSHSFGKGLVQMEARDKSGRVFPVEVSLATAESGEGAILVYFIRDISDRLAAQKDLVEARDKALAGEEAKAELLAVMSHEMRTPLNGVLGGLELLSGTELSDRQKGFVDIMDRSGRMLLHHVNAVLDISRDDAGKTVLRLEPFDPASLLQDVVDSQFVQAEARGNRLRLNLDQDLGLVIGDRTRLLQVIINLVANAIKFTRDGDIALSVQRQGTSDIVEFRVTDTGIGIPETDQPRIFEDFVTLDTRYAREVEGTGLGLGIARRMVDAMGGQIGVDSVPGEGSEFWLTVPLPAFTGAEPVDMPSGAQPPGPMRITGTFSVLLVEDNAINRLILREMLSAIGCTTAEASDGVEAEALTATRSFDLILMDISMPRRDGVEATRGIRHSSGPNRSTPIVALTAHALPADVDRFHAAGMNAVLVKPLTQAALIGLMERFGSEEPTGVADVPLQVADIENTMVRAREELANHLGQIDDILTGRGDLEELRRRTHLAAGLAAVLGMTDLQNAFVTLELAVSELDGDEGEAAALDEMLAEARRLYQDRADE